MDSCKKKNKTFNAIVKGRMLIDSMAEQKSESRDEEVVFLTLERYPLRCLRLRGQRLGFLVDSCIQIHDGISTRIHLHNTVRSTLQLSKVYFMADPWH